MRIDVTVLVVDDEERLRKTLVQMVRTLEFMACATGTAEEALRILQSTDPPKIVLLDLQLPAMHGLDLFQWITRERPDTRVIVLTGFGDLDSAQQAIRFGVVDYLTKPCTMGEIERALDRACGQLRRRSIDNVHADKIDISERAPATLDELEQQYILDTLRRHAGNRRLAAEELGISLRKLYYRLAEYEVE